MAWFSAVVQDVRSRSNGLRERVREQAKALGRGVGYEKPSVQSAFLSAQEAQSRIEAEASRLSQCQSASEVLERWLALLRTAPRRYTDGQKGQLRQLSFKQVFLRSKALELALDASARSAELRLALRTYALAVPARWPESCPPPMAFARAFVALLWSTVGPTEKWLQLLGTLLSSEQTPSAGNEAEEPCHTWLVQLIAGRRQNWQASDVVDRETEILQLEEKAIDGLKEDTGGSDLCFTDELRRLSSLSSAVFAVESMADRRSSLAEDVERAIIAEKEQDDVYENTVNSVATAAKALANSLSTEAVNADGLTERRAQLCSKSDAMKERLSELTPDVDRLSQEISAAEEVQRELVQQLKQNKEHLESLRRQRDDCRKEEEHLRHSLQRTEQKLATQLATEDAARQRCEASQALAFAVADVAHQLKAKQSENGSTGSEGLMTTQQRNGRQRKELLLLLATGEVRRLKKAAEVAQEALPLAKEFAAKQGDMASPTDTPVTPVEDVEVEKVPNPVDLDEECKDRSFLQDLRQCMRELKTLRAEKIVSMLEETSWKDEGNATDATGLADEIRQRLPVCRELLESLEAIALPFEEKDAWEVVEDPGTGESFLFGEQSQEREASGWDTSFKNIFNGLAARAVGGAGTGTNAGADDPFLLAGLEADESHKNPALQVDAASSPAKKDLEGFVDPGLPLLDPETEVKDPTSTGTQHLDESLDPELL